MKITGILLAAGQSSRFGCNKLSYKLNNGLLIGQVTLNSILSATDNLVVVVPPDKPTLQKLFRREGVQIVACPNAHEGIGTSLAFGITRSLPTDGWIVIPADMPFVKHSTIELVVRQLKTNKADICAPYYRNRRGHPVGFSGRFEKDLRNLRGDSGARTLIENNTNLVTRIDCNDPGVLADIDTPEDLSRYQTLI